MHLNNYSLRLLLPGNYRRKGSTTMGMSTRMQYILEEAHYFLDHVEKQVCHVPHVDFYLSAFVSAARSTSEVMQADLSHAPGWNSGNSC